MSRCYSSSSVLMYGVWFRLWVCNIRLRVFHIHYCITNCDSHLASKFLHHYIWTGHRELAKQSREENTLCAVITIIHKKRKNRIKMNENVFKWRRHELNRHFNTNQDQVITKTSVNQGQETVPQPMTTVVLFRQVQ